MELERLSKIAPSEGVYPVTVDPRVNEVLAEKMRMGMPEYALSLAAELGLTPPPIPADHRLGGLGLIWLGDDDLVNPGIVAWNIYNPTGEEP